MSDFAIVVGELAGDARIRLDDEGYPQLVMPSPRFDRVIWDKLCREGWIESMPNGGTFKISDAGLRAYLRSTDEMGDGSLTIGETAITTT